MKQCSLCGVRCGIQGPKIQISETLLRPRSTGFHVAKYYTLVHGIKVWAVTNNAAELLPVVLGVNKSKMEISTFGDNG
jgi:hypothetical protein